MTNDRLTPILVEVLDEIEEERNFFYNRGLLTEEHDYLLEQERQEVLSLIDEGWRKWMNPTYVKKRLFKVSRKNKLYRDLVKQSRALKKAHDFYKSSLSRAYNSSKFHIDKFQRELADLRNLGRKRRMENMKDRNQRGASSNFSPKHYLSPKEKHAVRNILYKLKAYRNRNQDLGKRLRWTDQYYNKHIGLRDRALRRLGKL